MDTYAYMITRERVKGMYDDNSSGKVRNNE